MIKNKQIIDVSYIIKWCENTIDVILKKQIEVEKHFELFLKNRGKDPFKLKITLPKIQHLSIKNIIYNNVFYITEIKNNGDSISLLEFNKLVNKNISYLKLFLKNIKKYKI